MDKEDVDLDPYESLFFAQMDKEAFHLDPYKSLFFATQMDKLVLFFSTLTLPKQWILLQTHGATSFILRLVSGCKYES